MMIKKATSVDQQETTKSRIEGRHSSLAARQPTVPPRGDMWWRDVV